MVSIRTYPNIIENILSDCNIANYIKYYESSRTTSETTFKNIQQHHNKLLNDDWDKNTRNSSDLEIYGDAAFEMGRKQWVIDGNKWVDDLIYEFYCKSGAKTAFSKDLKSKLMRSDNGAKIQSTLASQLSIIDDVCPSNLTMYTCTEDEDKSVVDDINSSTSLLNHSKIRILDVGSCYNPLQRSSHTTSGLYDVLAIDLFPKDDSVIKCDFLGLQLTEAGSPPVFHYDEVTKTKSLVSLPARSFDVIVMSLVLNYIPNHKLREEMIQKASMLLCSPPYSVNSVCNLLMEGGRLSTPSEYHMRQQYSYAGLLLIFEKGSIFNKTHSSHRKNKIVVSTRHSNMELSSYDLRKCWINYMSGQNMQLFKYIKKDGNKNSKSICGGGKGIGSCHMLAFRKVTSDDGTRKDHCNLLLAEDLPENGKRHFNAIDDNERPLEAPKKIRADEPELATIGVLNTNISSSDTPVQIPKDVISFIAVLESQCSLIIQQDINNIFGVGDSKCTNDAIRGTNCSNS
jgi:hypothetical protein